MGNKIAVAIFEEHWIFLVDLYRLFLGEQQILNRGFYEVPHTVKMHDIKNVYV